MSARTFKLLALFVAFALLCAPVSGSLWSFLFKPRQVFYPADINGDSIWLSYLAVDYLDANTQIVHVDLNVINDANIEGDLNVYGSLGVSSGAFLNELTVAGDANFVNIGISENAYIGGNTYIDGNLFVAELATLGTITSGDITIFDTIPILVFKDSDDVGAASTGFIEWKDSTNGRAGFFGNSSRYNDDLVWKNESSGGNIEIKTTGAGKFEVSGDFNATGDSNFTNIGLTGILFGDINGYLPYAGAVQDINIGIYGLTAEDLNALHLGIEGDVHVLGKTYTAGITSTADSNFTKLGTSDSLYVDGNITTPEIVTMNQLYVDNRAVVETDSFWNIATSGVMRGTRYANSAAGAAIILKKARGREGTEDDALDDDMMVNLKAQPWDLGASDFASNAGWIRIEADGDHASGSVPTKFVVGTTPSGDTAAVDNLVLDKDGNLSVTSNITSGATSGIIQTGVGSALSPSFSFNAVGAQTGLYGTAGSPAARGLNITTAGTRVASFTTGTSTFYNLLRTDEPGAINSFYHCAEENTALAASGFLFSWGNGSAGANNDTTGALMFEAGKITAMSVNCETCTGTTTTVEVTINGAATSGCQTDIDTVHASGAKYGVDSCTLVFSQYDILNFYVEDDAGDCAYCNACLQGIYT